MNEMKGPTKSIEGSQHEIDFDAEADLAGEGVGPGAGTEDAEMSPSSSTSDGSNEGSVEVGTPDSVSEGNGTYSPDSVCVMSTKELQAVGADSSLSEYEVSLLSAESLVQHNKNVETKKNNDQYRAILLKRRTDGISPYSDGTYATAETPGGAGGAGGAGLQQMEQNSTVKSLANSLETGADTPVQPILKFLGGKVTAARGKIVTTLPITEKERLQARAILEAENTEREQVASEIKNGKADNGAFGSGNGRVTRQRTASKACTHAPNGFRWDNPAAGPRPGSSGGGGSSSQSGAQRKRGNEDEGGGSPTKVRKDDTPATKTAQGLEKLHMVDTEIVGKPVTVAVDTATSGLEDGEVEIVAVVETQES